MSPKKRGGEHINFKIESLQFNLDSAEGTVEDKKEDFDVSSEDEGENLMTERNSRRIYQQN